MPKNILIATTNPGKIYEYKYVLSKLQKPLNFIFLDSIKTPPPAPDETGATYEENALIKADFYFEHFDIPVISDDSGIEINALGSVPGIHTARFLDEHGDNNFKKLESLLTEKDPNNTNKSATFYCCAIYKDEKSTVAAHASIDGTFTFPPQGAFKNSYGYDPIFKLKNINRTLAEIDTAEKLKHSPRVNVINKIFKKLEQ